MDVFCSLLFLSYRSEKVDTHLISLRHKQDVNMENIEKVSDEQIQQAFKDDCCGGQLRPICNRRIDGFKCRCYVRYVIIDGVQYWKIHYLINQRPVTDPYFKPWLSKMYRIVRTALSLLESSGNRIIVFKNDMPV